MDLEHIMRQSFSTGAVESAVRSAGVKADQTNIFHDEYLKHWLAGLPASVEIQPGQSLPTIIAVGGGKGGVGKSVVSSNLSAKLAGSGKKVLAIDLDLGGANLHTYFGQRVSKPSLADYFTNDAVNFESIISESGVDGVSLITSGQSHGMGAIRHKGENADKLWNELVSAKSQHGYDYVVLDLGAGTDAYTTDFFLAAHVGIVTVLPEPTSVENAYTFLKALLWKLIKNAGERVGCTEEALSLADSLIDSEDTSLTHGYLQKLLERRSENPKLINCVIGAMMGRKLGFLVNQIRTQKDIDIAKSMAQISKNYFGWKTVALGFMNYDESAWKSLRNKKLIVQDFPQSMISKRLDDVLARATESLTKF
jgi:flagellar biosynthesis protein FlhG